MGDYRKFYFSVLFSEFYFYFSFQVVEDAVGLEDEAALAETVAGTEGVEALAVIEEASEVAVVALETVVASVVAVEADEAVAAGSTRTSPCPRHLVTSRSFLRS